MVRIRMGVCEGRSTARLLCGETGVTGETMLAACRPRPVADMETTHGCFPRAFDHFGLQLSQCHGTMTNRECC